MTDTNHSILIIDDHLPVRKTIAAILRNYNFNLLFGENGPEGLEIAQQIRPDLILLDVMMPQMSGYEVLETLRADPRTKEIPVIMITALDDKESRLKGIESGADEYLSKPIDRSELIARIQTIIRLNRYRSLINERERFERLIEISPDGIVVVSQEGNILLANQTMVHQLGQASVENLLNTQFLENISPEHKKHCFACFQEVMSFEGGSKTLEAIFLRVDGSEFPAEINAGKFTWDNQPAVQIIVRDITDRKKAELALQKAHDELIFSYEATLKGWVRALDLRDNETEGHTQRVTKTVMMLAMAMGIKEDGLANIRRGALLHDIGKIGVPDGILHKPGPLSDDEWDIMRQHPVHARNMLAPIPFLQSSIEIPYGHHERWNGAGYPQGLKEDKIPIAARIFAVVDVWDALVSDRPYRKAWPESKVLKYLQDNAGIQFDPEVVKQFISLYQQGKVKND